MYQEIPFTIKIVFFIVVIILIVSSFRGREKFKPLSAAGEGWEAGASISKIEAGELQIKSFNSDTKKMIMRMIYPINSIMIYKDDPNTIDGLEGTVWTQLATGSYIKSGDSIGNTGGIPVSGSTALEVKNLPKHSHEISITSDTVADHTHGSGGGNTQASGVTDVPRLVKHTGIRSADVGILPGPILVSIVTTKDVTTRNDLLNSLRTHTHSFASGIDKNNSAGIATGNPSTPAGGHKHTITGSITETGSGIGHSHTITPPYMELRFWKRTE